MSYAIFADSTCDLDKNLRDKYDIDYVAMNYVIDNVEYSASLDWDCHSPKAFYDIMRDGVRIRTTQVLEENFKTGFEPILQEGKDIIYIACSSALSGSINIGRLASRELCEKYPDRKIYCVDSLISSFGQGSMAIKASKLRSEGKSAEEVVKYLEDNRLCYCQCATVGSLSYLKRAGRVTASSAFFGNLLGVKPILISDKLGQNFAVKKVKGSAAARREIADEIAENVIAPEQQTLYISHADALEDAELLRDEIMSKVAFKDCYLNYITTIVGASVGPGTVAAYYVGKEVTVEGRD